MKMYVSLYLQMNNKIPRLLACNPLKDRFYPMKLYFFDCVLTSTPFQYNDILKALISLVRKLNQIEYFFYWHCFSTSETLVRVEKHMFSDILSDIVESDISFEFYTVFLFLGQFPSFSFSTHDSQLVGKFYNRSAA